jgi:hypothetical protein
MFEKLLGDEEPRPKMPREDFLQEEYARRLAAARVTLDRQGAEKILDESLPWLLESSRLLPLGRNGERSLYGNGAFRGTSGDTVLSFCYQRSTALTRRLQKIDRYWKPGQMRLQILRDPSVKVGPVGSNVLAALKAKGAKEIYPLPEALAALHAIRDLRATAQSGELNQDGIPIDEAEVTAWALRNLPSQVERLREELSGEGTSEEDPRLSKLSELVNERKIVAAEIAARELSLSVDHVVGIARRHPMRFGLLAGPPVVVFEAIEGPPAESSSA